MTLKLSKISTIEYRAPGGQALEDSLKDGATQIFLLLNDGTEVELPEPIKVQDDNGNFFFLKVPNPCNHKLEITYVETAVATLVRQLLSQYDVVVPAYRIQKLKASPTSEYAPDTDVPCCIIEAIDEFEPFGECGTDISAYIEPHLIARLSEEKQKIRARQCEMLFSRQFAAYSAVCWFVGENDSHQQNFGTGKYLGKEKMVALDFDFSVLPFLIEQDILGLSQKPLYPEEDGYHRNTPEGRFSPHRINLSRFPEQEDARSLTPDNWFSNWCSKFCVGLVNSEHELEFRQTLFAVFSNLSHLSAFYFEMIFLQIAREFPESKNIMESLSVYFDRSVAELRHVLSPQLIAFQQGAKVVRRQPGELNPIALASVVAQDIPSTQLPDTPLFGSSVPEVNLLSVTRYSFYTNPQQEAAESLPPCQTNPLQKKGGSPELGEVFWASQCPPPPQ